MRYKGYYPSVDLERYNMWCKFGGKIFDLDVVQAEKLKIIQDVIDTKSANDNESAQSRMDMMSSRSRY